MPLSVRARRHRKRPPPTEVVCGNAMSVSTSAEHAAQIFRNILALQPAIALVTEAAKFNAAKVAGREWDVIQYGYGIKGDYSDESREALAGCVIAVRDEVAMIVEDSEHIRLGSKATREGWRKTGHGIRARYIVTARVVFHPGTKHQRTRRVAVGHPPPARAPYARAAFMVRLAATRASIKAGDLNLRYNAVAKLLGGNVRSVGLLHIVTAPWQPISPAKAVDVRGDHLAAAAWLWPLKKEK